MNKDKVIKYLKNWKTLEDEIFGLESLHEDEINDEVFKLLEQKKLIVHGLTATMTLLNEAELKIIYDFYHEKKKIETIYCEMNISRSQLYRVKNKALEKIGLSDLLH